MKKKPAKKAAPRKKLKPAREQLRKSTRTVSTKRTQTRKVIPTSARSSTAGTTAADTGDGKLNFNHAMIYLKDVGRGIAFYRDWLGFKVIEDYRHEGRSVYARLRAPGGDGTLALHQAGPGASVASDGVRLYFEVRDLDDFCHKLRKRGFYFTQLPQVMPWGWRHAYLNDPEGHEISLYWAGDLRMKKSVMKVAREAESAE